ncbi:MAG: 3'-5' exoribonuclease [Armatimonadetes bacterium]|nr:3'-5' exoribonuclease [Armatimonadota bacterium]
MDFVAIDVETANPNMASICQVGVVAFSDGTPIAEWSSYVDPQDWFAPLNVALSGIDENTVKGAPTLPDIAAAIRSHLDGNIVVSHTSFDRVSIHQAFDRHCLESPQCTWLDSARVARRTWDECQKSGYGLASVCSLIGYDFTQHDALEDARAAGQVMLAAMSLTGMSAGDWLRRVRAPVNPSVTTRPSAREGDPNGPLFGELMAFTGALQIPRREATDIAAAVGCQVVDNVTTTTTILVVGDQDIAKLAGHEKSSKHRKAEALLAQGLDIRILGESDFKRLIDLAGHERES